jgi:hypothetical protein
VHDVSPIWASVYNHALGGIAWQINLRLEKKSPAGPRGAAGRGGCDAVEGSGSALARDDARSFGRIAALSPIRGDDGQVGLIDQEECGADPSAWWVRFLPLASRESFRVGRRVLATGGI